MKLLMIIVSCVACISIAGCQDSGGSDTTSSSVLNTRPTAGGKVMNDILSGRITIDDVPQSKWEKLAGEKIYFGHQSVGLNIIDGIKAVISENSKIKLKIIESRNPSDFNAAVFAHSSVGKNEDPQSKTEDFSQIMNSGIGKKVDISFHKYCYVDADSRSNSEGIFRSYSEQMQLLINDYPEVQFVHLTMPLTTIQTGPKAWIKKVLGKPIGGLDSNIKRNEYNVLLKENYKNKELVFDLAAVEAQRPDKSFESFTKNGKTYLSMYKGYSDDGGHLNKFGKKVIAEKLLVFLANIQE